MIRVGRRRTKNLKLPAGVGEKEGVWYWQPTTERERAERRKLRAEAKARGERFTVGCTLGPAGSIEARKKWAEVSGFADLKEDAGTVAELLHLWKRDPKGIKLQANGEPRADSTIEDYEDAVIVLEEKFGRCLYGKTEQDVMRGHALGTAPIQLWADQHPHKGMLKREFAALDNVFTFAIRQGRTTYNPCAEVALGPGGVREREPLAWEVECLRSLAKPRLGLQMDYEEITGWRISGILELVRARGTADGVRVRYKKRGKRWLWEWSPKLRRIWREAEALPYASKFPASPIFPARGGGVLSYKAFDCEWQALKRRANAELAAGVIDPDTLERHAALAILDLHFHDLRSKAHDDAEDAGVEGNEFLGNSRAVARRVYRRRARRMRPLG